MSLAGPNRKSGAALSREIPLDWQQTHRQGSGSKTGTVLSETNGRYYRHLAMIFPSRSQLASKQITPPGRAESVTKEGLAATLLLARQPDRMGQRHPLRPVRPRSRPGPLPCVVFQHQCGRCPFMPIRSTTTATTTPDLRADRESASSTTRTVAAGETWPPRSRRPTAAIGSII